MSIKDEEICLDSFINEINDELTISCQIPFTVPRKAILRIIKNAKNYFYKIYEDSVEELFIAVSKNAWETDEFKGKDAPDTATVTNEKLFSKRGQVIMPPTVYSVHGVYEIGGFEGEDGGFGSTSFSSGDPDFALDKFVYSDAYGAGLGAENLMYFVINEKYIDNARQFLQQQISYTYNRLTHKFRFQGELPKGNCIFQVYNTIPDCNLFNDEAFYRYCVGMTKTQLGRILGTFEYNLPGNISINADLIASEGREDIDRLLEEIKTDEGADYFFTA